MKEFSNPRFLTIAGIILFAAISRVFPTMPNFQPILAIALFAGYYMTDKKLAILIPIGAMLISDILIELTSPIFFGYYTSGFHSIMPFVYGAMIISVFLGSWLIKRLSAFNVIASSLVSAVIFFVVTNFGSWLLFDMYPKNLSGLLMSYEMAIPFFRNTAVSTLLYSAAIFGGFSLAEKYIPTLVESKIK